jgi:hypothetical protein
LADCGGVSIELTENATLQAVREERTSGYVENRIFPGMKELRNGTKFSSNRPRFAPHYSYGIDMR